MSYQLNDAPNRLLGIFGAADSSILDTFDFASINATYPNEVEIIFDENLSYYYTSLQNCFLENNFKNKKDALQWQVRQVYRIVNSLIASNHPDVKFKTDLIKLKNELQENEYLIPLLENIKSGKIKPDIICSGEGYWMEGDGNLNFDNSSATVVMYTAPGMILHDNVGWDIENSRFKPEDTVIECLDTGAELKSRSLVKEYNKSCVLSLPNFTLTCRSNLRARLIETLTGEILATPTSITLNEIVQKYPDRKLHWDACAEMFDKNNRNIGQFAGLQLNKKQVCKNSTPPSQEHKRKREKYDAKLFSNHLKNIPLSSSGINKRKVRPKI